MNIIETDNLCKQYGAALRVAHLDMRVPEGSVYGFLGPNGAGKSTTLKMLLGLVRPTEGSIRMLGKSMDRTNRLAILRQVGSLIESPSYYGHLTGEEDANVYLGRPWRDFAKTAFVRCTMDSHICPEGWQNWGRIRAEVLCDYVEYANEGPGAAPEKRAPFSRQLENPQLDDYFSRENVLKGPDGWNP